MTYIIAEIGCNHNGDILLAHRMVDEAFSCGVDAVKFQTFQADKLISRYAPKAEYQKITTGEADSQLEMTRKLELSREEYQELCVHARRLGLDVFSTPFDEESLDFLITTGMSTFKIPSGEITNLPFLEKIGQQRKKVILSTGMATMEEIHWAVEILRKEGTDDITVLHCTTEYPSPVDSLNMRAILSLKKEFPHLHVGFSDHSVGHEAAIMACTLGAEVVEKHFTLNQNLPGPDHKASATPEVLKRLVAGVRFVEKALGSGEKKPAACEIANKIVARKSIVAKRFIRKGEVFSVENITLKRPGSGISPKDWYRILGKEAQSDFEEDRLIVDSRFANQE